MKFKGSLIVVKDCKKALKYYQDMFGFALIRDNDGNMELSGNLYLQDENTGSVLRGGALCSKAIKLSCILKSRRSTVS